MVSPIKKDSVQVLRKEKRKRKRKQLKLCKKKRAAQTYWRHTIRKKYG